MQIANEYVITHTNMYEAIFWVHVEEAITLENEFDRLVENLSLVLKGTTNAQNQVVIRWTSEGLIGKACKILQ